LKNPKTKKLPAVPHGPFPAPLIPYAGVSSLDFYEYLKNTSFFLPEGISRLFQSCLLEFVFLPSFGFFFAGTVAAFGTLLHVFELQTLLLVYVPAGK